MTPRDFAATAMHHASAELTAAINHDDFNSTDENVKLVYNRRVAYRARLYRIAVQRWERMCERERSVA